MELHAITLTHADLKALKPRAVRPRSNILLGLLAAGVIALLAGLSAPETKLFWGSFYVNLLFFMGLAAGSCVLPAIFQLVGAVWAKPIRRFAEASANFLPVAWLCLAFTWLGRRQLFAWANGPMTGKEAWMQPEFVYARNLVLLGLLFWLMRHFVSLSAALDLDLVSAELEDASLKERRAATEKKLNILAPLLILAYCLIYSFFAFEMVMGMDQRFYSTLFGGFTFIENLYLAFAGLSLSTLVLSRSNSALSRLVSKDQLWDLGKLCFAFSMLWGYLMFSQFLPIWYTNLPEETQWLILRTRELPWKGWAYITLGLCFIIPFICLLSRDLKRTPKALGFVCGVILCGVWSSKYLVVMPQLSGGAIPFRVADIALAAGFAGAYLLAIRAFYAIFPAVNISKLLNDCPRMAKFGDPSVAGDGRG